MTPGPRSWILSVTLAVHLLVGGGTAWAEGLWDVYQLARERDAQFRAAEAALDIARQARPKAMASMLPSVVASGSSGLNRFDDKNPVIDTKTGLPTAGHHYDSLKYGLYFSQPVFNLQSWAGLYGADQRLQEAEAVFQSSRAEMMVRVLERYLKFLGAEEKLHWVRAERLALAQALARAKRAAELGLVSPLAEQRALAASDLAEADGIAAENQMENARDQLRELTGQPFKRLARLRTDLELAPPSPNELEYWQRLALDLNFMIQAKGHAQEAARLEVYRQMAGHLPTVNFTASHYYENSGGGRVPGEDVMSTVMLELRVPIFEGGAATAQTREARAAHDKARADGESQRRQVVKQVGTAFRGVNESARRVKALNQALKSNLAAVAGALREVELGSGTIVEFLEALRDLYRVRRDHTDARHDMLLQRTRLLEISGRLDEENLAALGRSFQERDLPELMASVPTAFVPPE